MQISTSPRGDFTITLVKRSEAADHAGRASRPASGRWTRRRPRPDEGETHEHDELAWRLRHLKRSVLKNQGESVPGLTRGSTTDNPWVGLGRAVGESARLASSILSDLPLEGQFNLLTTTSFDSPQESVLARCGVAAQHRVRVALVADAERRVADARRDHAGRPVVVDRRRVVRARGTAVHAYQAGFSYGMQRYAGGNAEALAAMRDGSRTVGMLYAYDNWALTRAVRVDFGGRYANYRYLEDLGLFSPRAGVTVKPSEKDSLTLRASVSHRESAPGADGVHPAGHWGVAAARAHVFSGVRAARSGPSASITSRWGRAPDAGDVLLGVRAFRQRGEDQIVTLFGVGTSDEIADTGHYRVGSAGDFEAVGWGVSVSRSVGTSTRASVDYSQADARWIGRIARHPGAGARGQPRSAALRSRARPDGDRRERGAGVVHSRLRALQAQYAPSPPTASIRRWRAARASTSRSTRRCRSGSRGRGGKRSWR